jgi:hypothetical protein
MIGLVFLVLLMAWAWWAARRLVPAEPPSPATPSLLDAAVPALLRTIRPPLGVGRPAVAPSRSAQHLPPLTEDHLIAFGLALESADDVLAELTRPEAPAAPQP